MGATVYSYHLVSKAIEVSRATLLTRAYPNQYEHVIIRGREHLTESEVSCCT